MSEQGRLLDLCQVGCQVEGTGPVAVGMLLKLSISPAHKEDNLCVEEARVLWVKEDTFGLEFRRLPPTDHRWLLRFLDNAERRNSYRIVDQTSAIEDLAAKPLALPLRDCRNVKGKPKDIERFLYGEFAAIETHRIVGTQNGAAGLRMCSMSRFVTRED